MIEGNFPLFSPTRISLQPEENSASHLKLHKNEVVEGKVIKSFSPDKTLLLIKGRQVMARVPVPLKEGRVLSLKVEDPSSVPNLKLLGIKFKDSDHINISKLLTALKVNPWMSANENIGNSGLPKEALFPFRELMTDLSQRLFLKSSPELLRLFIDKSGLNWEAKLKKLLTNKTIGRDVLNRLLEGDLKGLLSRFIALEKEDGGLLRGLVSTIENFQLLNHLGLETDRKIFLPVPMQFPDGLFTVGQLLIHLPEEDNDESSMRKSGEDLFKITFLLELSNLGPLRADLNIMTKEIAGRFLLTNEKAKALVEKNIPVFVNRLKERGFSIRYIECSLKAPEVVNEPLINEIVREEGSSISLIA